MSTTWNERILWTLLTLAAAVCVTGNVADPDLWGHVQYGRDALRDGLPATATYTYTAQGYPWINHENLAELTFAVLADTVGPLGLVWFKAILGVGVLLLIARHARRQGAGLVTVCGMTILVSMNLVGFWSLRPQIFGFTYLAALFLLLEWCFAGWTQHWRLPWLRHEGEDQPAAPAQLDERRMLWLWACVPLLFFWTNTHGGFIAGWCLLTAYLGCRAFEALALQGRAAIPLCLRLGSMSLAAGLATLVNPYGPGLHLKLFKKLSTPRPEITEWRAPPLFDVGFSQWWVLLAVVVAALLLSRKQRDFTHLVILALTSWQALSHLRHIPFVALTAAIFLPPHIESALRRLRLVRAEALDDIPPRWRPCLAGAAAVVFLLVGAKLAGRLSDLPVERSRWPVSAFQWMADQDLKGRLVIRFEWAQYAIMAFGADREEDGMLVAFDGRFRTCYPQEVIDMLFDFQLGPQDAKHRHRSPKSGPINPTRVLEAGQPDLAVVGRDQPDSIHALKAHGGWTLLYQDSAAQVWGRSSKYGDPASPDYLSPERRRLGNEPQLGSVTWPALPKRRLPERSLAANSPTGD